MPASVITTNSPAGFSLATMMAMEYTSDACEIRAVTFCGVFGREVGEADEVFAQRMLDRAELQAERVLSSHQVLKKVDCVQITFANIQVSA